ncbi:MAG: hypothetical protein HY232_05735 [Acidobacteria bacterium]|nr:hypothetical protein [Acidobacteriota bacterium]
MSHKLNGRLLIYTLLVITVVYTVVLLATFNRVRTKTFSRIGVLYQAAFKTPEKETVTHVEIHARTIAEMPPAPAGVRRPSQVTLKMGPHKPVWVSAADAGEDPAAQTARVPAVGIKKPLPITPTEPATISRTKEQEVAYDNLLLGNKKMAELVNHSDPKRKFKTWLAVRSEGNEHWIAVVFQNTDDRLEVQYTWSINNTTRRISPINHYAKQLAAK